MSRPLPDTSDPEFAPFWAGALAGELRLVFCSKCQQPQWPPRPMCGRCGGFEFDWRAVGTSGRLYTWTVVQHQTTPGLPPPYVVGLVELADHPGVRLLGQVIGDIGSLSAGMSLVARFDRQNDSVALVNWVAPDHSTGKTAK